MINVSIISSSGTYFIKPCMIGRIRLNSTVLAWLTLCYKPFREGAKAVFMVCNEFYEFPWRFPFPLSVSLEFYLPSLQALVNNLLVWQSSCASKLCPLKTANIFVQPLVNVQLMIRTWISGLALETKTSLAAFQ